MDFFTTWGLLIAGLVLLVGSGDVLVRGSVSIAKQFKLSPLVVGMTIVAFGTSAPELIVSIQAAVSGHPEIALGNVIGSNITNIALVLGITTVIIVIPVKSSHLIREWLILMVVSFLFIFFLKNNTINRIEGIILIIALVGFIVYSLRSGDVQPNTEHEAATTNIYLSIAMIIAASAGLAYGADLLVGSASAIASKMGISERVISITIVAFGTSVPELAASVISALKKQTDISIGNIIGSNLFNIMAVIGITATVHPIQAEFKDFFTDFAWMLIFSVLLILLVQPYTIGKRKKGSELNRSGGVLLLGLYVIYIFLLFYTI